MNVSVRLEKPEDYREVENLTREAFWNHHVPGCDEHYLAHIMRGADAFIPELDFVAEADGKLVGNIMYAKGRVDSPDGKRHDVILFGPLSVLPEYQGKGVGTVLVRHSMGVAQDLGYEAILIYGDPLYYSRHGFRAASEFGITPPGGKPHPALQAVELREGALSGIHGEFHEDAIYEAICPEDVEAFDRDFPPKVKGFAESQKRFAELSGGKI